jgi:FKBP-type peptidyl-prolyl cis-trans isomerase FkpA
MKRKLIISLVAAILLISAYFVLQASGLFAKKVVATPDIKWSKEQSTDLGKELAIQEELEIKIYLESHKDWKMIRTGSGLRYMLITEGNGDSIRSGDVAEIEYKIKQLDGTLLVETADDEYEEFVVDKSEIETGIQEGIKYLKVGDKARFIIPSHIGHGLVGDMDKIPPLTTLVVEINVLGKL